MNYWIFKCNPEKYCINERLENPEPRTTWRVTRYKTEIQAADIAFIWRTGQHRGICAVMRIDTVPQEMPELDSEKPYCVDLDTGVTCRVAGTFIQRFPCVSHEVLRSVPELENLSIFHGYQQATNFPVTPLEGEVIMNVIQKQTV